MASMLELPRELYLMICSYLQPKDLVNLAFVSRDHYLAVQHPLFTEVQIKSYDRLVKLLATVLKPPVVSHISEKQRRNWHKLSDAQLRERDISKLDVLLDASKSKHIVGVVLERCITAIVHKCPDIKIHLTMLGLWPNGVQQLRAAALPNVKYLTLFAGRGVGDRAQREDLRHSLWELVFEGSIFPDLREVSLDTFNDGHLVSMLSRSLSAIAGPINDYGDHNGQGQCRSTYHGLTGVEKIALRNNTFLTPVVLQSLFNSSIIPKRLTTLEIVNCPRLDPVRDLGALSTLLLRSLQLLQHLKLHLVRLSSFPPESQSAAYTAAIEENPEHHLCNLVRKLGPKMKSIDLVLPFACNRMFVTVPEKISKVSHEPLELPTMAQEPHETLPQRIMDAGYRYRRLVIRGDICRGGHGWDDMVALAMRQDGNVSWDLLSKKEDKTVWWMSGFAPVEGTFTEAVDRPI